MSALRVIGTSRTLAAARTASALAPVSTAAAVRLSSCASCASSASSASSPSSLLQPHHRHHHRCHLRLLNGQQWRGVSTSTAAAAPPSSSSGEEHGPLMLHPKFWQTLDDSGGPAHFWGEQARRHITWYHDFHTVQHHDTDRGIVSWFLGGILNASFEGGLRAGDIDLIDAMAKERPYCEPEMLFSEEPLFMLYTSGSTGQPKGLVHSTAGYMTQAAVTHRAIFDYQPGDVYACVADVGWITGHSYVVYGPLANGATTLLFESIPTYPDSGRYWEMVERYGINQLYLAPTALRRLMKDSDEFVTKYDRSSLRVLGSVGEPLNPEAYRWFHEVVGNGKCSIVDTWWQTETGGAMISPLPGMKNCKAGSAMQPFLGVVPVILDNDGNELQGNNVEGVLAMKHPTPGMARTIHGDHERYTSTYWGVYPGYYFTGDGARRDEDGHLWITGRVDDVINVSGHRMGTAEIESALLEHGGVAEAAVVGYPHDVKGQGVYAYVILKAGERVTAETADELKAAVRRSIGGLAVPDVIQITPDLPKTRSGKIMRRILRKIAANQTDDLGDVTTLSDPEIVQHIIERHQALLERDVD
ncbi:acetyl-CoA synthetase [Salpingoeca rosetta]|uniref:acetate--CoA ligase n=1 Tax=Salpingoeca rosetta (strain ATCC 50818 / BSB-021) TaxID=946362 RepID=F2TZ34_SALR5|nr:acetyl-CoA synthetase [Salpingoeca rosetta]EGD78858.1 acetyl-CoA synthetase [Salpingoeca rosetta]|eukprot:XP_004997814.1 acetyl-CoA synthetase [Salpingoeca rosetta]